MNWPAHLPNNCPPLDAQNTLGTVYRLIAHSSPHPDDFRSWREDHMDQPLPQNLTECQAGGLSVFKDDADAHRTIKRIPRFRKSKLALGVLTPDLGKLLHTPAKSGPSHHTWWIPMNTKPWTVFQIISID